MRTTRPLLAVVMALAAVVPVITLWTREASADEAACAAMTAPIYLKVNPGNEVQLATPWANEAAGAVSTWGFTVDQGAPFEASLRVAEGVVGVHRLWNGSEVDFAYLTDDAEIASATRDHGYVDQGVRFYASPEALSCTVPVLRFYRDGVHRLALEGERGALEADGWALEGIEFHAPAAGYEPGPTPPPTTPPPTTPPPPTPPPAGGSTFSFAVIPDTQNEVYAGEQRMQKRVEWLLANREAEDLRWVSHIGDVHNWPTPDEIQFSNMSSWLRPLDGVLPYMLAVGNHDTAAVCPGGSACPGANANLGLRDTTMWNKYYSPARFGYEGVFEAGKSDNGWRTFSAGGKDWLILTIELWPRTAVIGWAEQVVASHPGHNVIVVSHEILNSDGSLSYGNGGYGANSPAALWNELDDYPNVQMMFSGHVGGQAANTSLTAGDGHKVATMLQAFHDPTYNPTRIVSVDTAAGTISTRIVANWDRTRRTYVDYEYTQWRATYSGMRFVG